MFSPRLGGLRAECFLIVRPALISILRKSSAAVLLAVVTASAVFAAPASGSQPPGTCWLPADVQTALLNPAFTDHLPNAPLMYPKVESLDDLEGHLSDLFMPLDLFEDAFENIAPTTYSHHCVDTLECLYNAFSISYVIGGRQYTGHAYYKKWADAQNRTNAAVIIPGSGVNQSTAVYLNDSNNYHYNIADLVRDQWDMHVCVRPNEDFLAIHNGSAKLNCDYIVPQLANLGGSYSARFLVDTMAIVKYLKSVYSKVAVIGLSQGGQAALYNFLQSQPDAAIIASGFSVIHETMQRAGIGQIMIPGMKEYLSNESILDGIQNSNTEYLFTWGWEERGIYGVEAWYRCTRAFFGSLSNVTCVSHDTGHVFPAMEVSELRITYFVEEECHVLLQVFDAKGRLVSSLVDAVLTPDLYIEEWDRRDDDGRLVSSGTCFYRLELPGRSEVNGPA